MHSQQDQFQNLIPLLGGFDTAKSLQHIGKYIRGSALEEFHRPTHALEVKIGDSDLDGIHYVCIHWRGYLS